MKANLAFSILTAALLAPAPAAAAATLTTTLVRSTAEGSILCNVVNAGKKPIQVVIRLRDLSGQILVESGEMEILPMQGNGIGDGANEDYYGFCEFEVEGSRKGVRASLQLRSSVANSAPYVVVPAQ